MRLKKFLASLLSLAICSGVFPATAASAALGQDMLTFPDETAAGAIDTETPVRIAATTNTTVPTAATVTTSTVTYSNTAATTTEIVTSTHPVTTTTIAAASKILNNNLKKADSRLLLGDLNGDNFVDSNDASIVLAAYANISSDKGSGLTVDQIIAADINHDNHIDSIDASKILAYYAFVSTDGTLSFEEFLKLDAQPATTTTTSIATTKRLTTATTTTRKLNTSSSTTTLAPTTATATTTSNQVNSAIQVTEIKLSKNKMNLSVNELDIAYATMLPSSATNKNQIWKSSDTTIATCDQYGWVKGIAPGTCTISVYSESNPRVKADIEVTVTDPNAAKDPTKVTSISLTKTKMTLGIGELDQALVTMLPATATNKNEVWKSSNTAVAKCDQDGWVKGVAPGTCTITVYSESNPSVKAEIEVTVTDPNKVTGITLSKNKMTLGVGELDISYVTMLPATATNKNEVWKSSNTAVAKCDQDGWVKGVAPGTCTITVYSESNPSVKAEIEVTVTDPNKVTGITLSKNKMTLGVGELDISYVTMLPATATNKNEIWTSSNTAVAKCDQDGWVKGVAPGTCTITVYSESNPSVKAEIEVTVTDPNKVTGITLSKNKMTLGVGELDISYVTMLPATATNKNEIWTSSNTAVAKCDQYGWVKGIAPGTCTITVKSESNPSVKAEIEVTVTDPNKVTGITLSKNKMTLGVGELDISYVTMLPATATNKNEIWTSSNTAVAKCDQYGWVKGVAPGTCTITVKSESNPNVYATIDVTVTGTNQTNDPNKVTGITLSKNKMTLGVGELDISYVTMLPSTATNKNEIWTSSNTAVAKCDQYGWVKGVAPGTCTITVKSESNPNVYATIDVTVKGSSQTNDPNKVTGITLSKNKMTLGVGELDISYVTMLPATATNKNEIWTSSNTAVAKCDQYGWVKGVAPGTCTITVKSESNPNVYATIDVTVTGTNQTNDPNKVTGITLSKNKMTLGVGELDISYVTMLPATATNKNEIWTSSNTAVAKCDQYGWVKGVAPGTCTITVKSESNPNVYATIDVTVTGTNQTNDPNKVTGITLSKNKMTLGVGELDISYVTMLPSTATNKNEIWTSSNTAVAKCDQYGWVKGVAPGTCTITVKSESNPNVYATIDVTVTGTNQTNDPNKVTGITLSKNKMTLGIGELDISYVTMLPATATNKNEIWISSNTAVAKCDQYGWVKGVAPGTCTITVKSESNPNVYATIDVTVTGTNQTNDPNKVTGITLSKNKMTLGVGELDISYVTMLPATATNKNEIWTSSNTAVAKCDQYGWVKGVAPGTCTITVKSESNPNVYATIDVTVTGTNQTNDPNKVTGITLSKNKMALGIGELDISYVTMLPATATNKNEIWTSSNTAVAKCDQYGWVKGVAPGTCTVTVKSESNPNVYATIDVTVTGTNQTNDPNKVTGITLSKNKMTLGVGELDISYVTMLPATATNKNEIWTSSNPNVAKCDQYGWVKGVAPGTCTITVKSESNPNVYATIDVTVTGTGTNQLTDTNKVTGITLTKYKMTLGIGELDQAIVTMLPATATNKDEIWTSSNTAVAKCDQYGWVKGVAPGTCKITVTSVSNPNVSATIDVTVV